MRLLETLRRHPVLLRASWAVPYQMGLFQAQPLKMDKLNSFQVLALKQQWASRLLNLQQWLSKAHGCARQFESSPYLKSTPRMSIHANKRELQQPVEMKIMRYV